MERPPSSDGSRETYHRAGSWVRAVGSAIGVLAAGWTILRWKPSRVAIEGASMAPTLLPGDWCLVVAPRSWRRGDVVVVEHPGRHSYEMVKRLIGLPGDRIGDRRLGEGEHWVEGDHPSASTDSRRFGPVTADALKARVVLVYAPARRRQVLARRS